MEKQLCKLILEDDIEEFKKTIENGFNVNKKLNTFSLDELIINNFSNKYIESEDIRYEGIYLLHFACGVSICEEIDRNNIYYRRRIYKPPIEIIKYLIEKGANVNKLDSDGCSPLHYAIIMSFDLYNENGKLNNSIVKLLIENGADVNIKNTSNYTPLFLIARNCEDRHIEKIQSNVKYLIENGAKVKINKKTDLNILTVFFRNLMHTYEEYVNINDDNEPAYDMDDYDDFWSIIDDIDDNWHPYPPMPDNVLELIKYLIDNGAKVNSRDENGKTILHYAVLFGTLEQVELLINSGADFRIKSDEQQNSSPFHSVMFSTRMYLIEYFTQLAVKVNNLTIDDLTILTTLVSMINNTDIKNEKNYHMKYNIAGILIRKGFNGSKYSSDTIIGREYELYQEDIENTKKMITEVCQEKKIPSEIGINILAYLEKETIHDVNFLFNKKHNSGSEKNVDINTKLLIDKVYNPDLLLFHESQRSPFPLSRRVDMLREDYM
tara:strand:+ start:8553 stop:10031 length:1479 start_codon:yes stop_codon:yes gene_type:complete